MLYFEIIYNIEHCCKRRKLKFRCNFTLAYRKDYKEDAVFLKDSLTFRR